MRNIFFLIFTLNTFVHHSQSQAWKLWASGLPQGVYPRIVIAPNHDIYYALLGAPNKLGVISKANTFDKVPKFVELPAVPRPSSVQNNIVALGCNALSQPMAGIYRTDQSEPWLFIFNPSKQSWDTSKADATPSLGGQCIVTSKNGTIFVSTRWAYIYKSLDHGKTFKAIDETKLLQADYPCYYPSFLNGSSNNGSIFSMNIDHNNRLYAGTETSGLIFSDDEGFTWHPADLFACTSNKYIYDTLSPMSPLSKSGNVAGIGFTKDNNVIWSGTDMWYYGWKNKLAFANMKDSITYQVQGIPDYLIQTGQQISKIVTTSNGTIFLHSGSSNGTGTVGIYKSKDGINWELFNNGITGQNDGQSQGSLAVDGNNVFMATRDGKIWIYTDSATSTNNTDVEHLQLKLWPNPAHDRLTINNLQEPCTADILNLQGLSIMQFQLDPLDPVMSINKLSDGLYLLRIKDKLNKYIFMKFIKRTSE